MLSNIVWSHIFLVNVVSKRWKYLRDQFVRKKREHETKLASGAGAPSATESKPDYIHYDRMTWILPYLSRARYAIHRLRHLSVLQCVTISFWIWPDDYLKILKTLVIICRGNSKKVDHVNCWWCFEFKNAPAPPRKSPAWPSFVTARNTQTHLWQVEFVWHLLYWWCEFVLYVGL